MDRSLAAVSIMIAVMGYGCLHGLELSQVVNLQALAIMVAGLGIVAMTGHSPERLRETFRAAIDSIGLGRKGPVDCQSVEDVVTEAIQLARIYRTEGPRSLEKAAMECQNPMLALGAALVAEGYDQWSLAAALDRYRGAELKKRREQIGLLNTMMRLAPALGMAGTVVSLMQVMQELGSGTPLGPAMAVALSSTLYGLLLANIIFLPLASRLKEMAEAEEEIRQLAAEALLAMNEGLHPMRIAERLDAFELYAKSSPKAQEGLVALANHQAASTASAGRGIPNPDTSAQGI